MRNCTALLTAGLFSACTTPIEQTDRPPRTRSASDAAFTIIPRPEPTPLPALQPTSRPQRQIEQMAATDLARWILPAEAARIASAEIFPPRWGRLTYAYLWEAPRPAGPAGVCEVNGWGVGFTVENENSLTPQQQLDPPMRPAFTVPEQRFRVVGSTRVEAGGIEPDCAIGQPYWGWSNAPSAQDIHAAARLMEQAQIAARQSRRVPFRLGCLQMRFDEPANQMVEKSCDDARALLLRLSPDLIKRVRNTPCDGDFTRFPEGECIALEYHDPAAPGTHSVYMVRLAGRERPLAVEIVQGMLPPH